MESTRLGTQLLNRRAGKASQTELEELRGDLIGAAKKLLLEYPEGSRRRTSRSANENRLEKELRKGRFPDLAELALGDEEVDPMLRISLRLALDIREHGAPREIPAQLVEALAPLLNPIGPHWTRETLHTAASELADTLLAELQNKQEDYFRWWQPDYLSVPLRRILCIDWQLSDVISALRYYPGRLIEFCSETGIRPARHLSAIPDQVLVETCGNIKNHIERTIRNCFSGNKIMDNYFRPETICYLFFESLRLGCGSAYSGNNATLNLPSLPKGQIDSYKIIGISIEDYIKKEIQGEKFIESVNQEEEEIRSFQDVAYKAIGELKNRYKYDPKVIVADPINRDHGSQLCWMVSSSLPDLRLGDVITMNDEEFAVTLANHPPISPYVQSLRRDRRNNESISHAPVKRRDAVSLCDFLLRKVRRKIPKKIFRDALIDRFKASFNMMRPRPPELRERKNETRIPIAQAEEPLKVRDCWERILDSLDSLEIERMCGNNQPAPHDFGLEDESETERPNQLRPLDGAESTLEARIVQFVLREIKPILKSNDFLIICSRIPELFKSE